MLAEYKGGPSERAELERLSNDWNFWSIKDIELTLARTDCALFYYPSEDGTSQWLGLVFLRISDEFAELLYVFVPKARRRQGIAEQMLTELFRALSAKGAVHNLFLEVRVSNVGAQRLYEQLGMRKIEQRRGYYSDGEDALIYRMVIESIE